jgi:hypothetical protein
MNWPGEMATIICHCIKICRGRTGEEAATRQGCQMQQTDFFYLNFFLNIQGVPKVFTFLKVYGLLRRVGTFRTPRMFGWTCWCVITRAAQIRPMQKFSNNVCKLSYLPCSTCRGCCYLRRLSSFSHPPHPRFECHIRLGHCFVQLLWVILSLIICCDPEQPSHNIWTPAHME